MTEWKINLSGRINNFNLPVHKSLMPIFEALVNSIHAIEEKRKTIKGFVGEINIKVTREQTLHENIEGSINNVEISDNGIGFNESNFSSFLESDSDYKINIGGKGVGRFSWLKTFDKTTINSVFLDSDNKFVRRCFDFTIETKNIDDSISLIEEQESNSTIILQNFKKEYRDTAPIKLNTIAIKIIQHCLVYFMDSNCPRIMLSDNKETLLLNNIFKEKILKQESIQIFKIEDVEFKLLHVKVDGTVIDKHKLYLCANNRLVNSREANKLIVDLETVLGNEEKFWYLGVITSSYFDTNVDMNRLTFNIPETVKESNLVASITMNKILDKVVLLIKEYLEDFLQPIFENKVVRIKNYVTKTSPQYRHLLKYKETELNNIKPNISDDNLDNELYRIKRDFDLENKQAIAKLTEDIKNGVISSAEYKSSFGENVLKVTDANKSILAEYIAHRKSMIDLMDSGMRRDENGKYGYESFMHDIIYPMKTTSDEIDFESHNLWLIDERLSYFVFASSDIPFDNKQKEKRPDLMLFDRSHLLFEETNDGNPFDTVVIFELKRPMRENLEKENDDPVVQVLNYMEKIKTNKVTDKAGRLIKVNEYTKFYLYVVCDVLDNYKSKLENNYGCTPTFDKLGYFRMNHNQYLEVLSYDKIINDAKKRNKILFDKLGL
jgi:hypothetical protein